MATRLDKELRRELEIGGESYILTISPEGLKLTLKGRRKGQELRWDAFVNGDAALATALNASLAQARPRQAAPPESRPPRRYRRRCPTPWWGPPRNSPPGSRPVVAIGDRVVLDHRGEPLLAGIECRPLRHRPRCQRAADLEPQVVMQ